MTVMPHQSTTGTASSAIFQVGKRRQNVLTRYGQIVHTRAEHKAFFSEGGKACSGRADVSTVRTPAAQELESLFIFEDQPHLMARIKDSSNLVRGLKKSAVVIDDIFGHNSEKHLSLIVDWEGTESLAIDVKFSGNVPEAVSYKRKFTEWLVEQDYELMRLLVIGVRFG